MRTVLLYIASLAQAVLMALGGAALLGIVQEFGFFRYLGVVLIGSTELLGGCALGLAVRVAYLFIKDFRRGDV